MTALGKLSFAGASLLISIAVYVHFSIGFWGDQDWELLVARMLIDGKRLYVDHVLVNPPLINYLYVPPVLLSMLVPGLLDFQAMVIFGLGFVAFAIYICFRLIVAHPGFADDKRRQMQFIFLLCFLFIYRIPTPFFWDREHIFLVLTFPYIVRWMPSLSAARFPQWLRVSIGCLAAIGFLIKPHCLLVFMGLQIICLTRRNRPHILQSIENRIIYCAGALYLIVLLLFTPEYFTLILPMLLLTYSAITAGTGNFFDATLITVIVPTFIMFRPRQTSPYRQDIYYLLWVTPFVLAYALSNNGWGYTYQPIITLLLFINGFVLWEFLYLRKQRQAQGLPAKQATAGAALCLLSFFAKAAIVLVYFTTVFTYNCDGDRKCTHYYSQYLHDVQASPAPHSFGMIGMNYSLWTRVSKLTGAPWVTRFAQFWMIPKFLVSDERFAERHQWILYYVASAMADDLNQKKPEIMFVEVSDRLYTIWLPKPVNWIDSLSLFINFREAWRHYAFVRTIDNCNAPDPGKAVGIDLLRPKGENTNCRYDVYRRIHP